MKDISIFLETMNKVKSFIEIVTKYDNCDFDLISGRYIVDAKSILGVLSLDISKPLSLVIHGDAEQIDDAVKDLTPYII